LISLRLLCASAVVDDSPTFTAESQINVEAENPLLSKGLDDQRG
jgi:hypothetical protein